MVVSRTKKHGDERLPVRDAGEASAMSSYSLDIALTGTTRVVGRRDDGHCADGGCGRAHRHQETPSLRLPERGTASVVQIILTDSDAPDKARGFSPRSAGIGAT